MLSVIAKIISSTLGLVLNKARNTAAEKLKEHGDVTDEKLRDVIVEDLNSIKTKIDGLARKDLLASYSFLEEGIIILNLALDEAKDEQISNDGANYDQDGGSKTTETTTRNKSESGVLNEAIELSAAINELQNTSDRLASTEKYFRAAREKATEAFCNEALSLPDRIMATKLRAVSKILECLQDTKAAAAGCMLFLEKLHNLSAIGENFSTHFKGGIKSRVYKDSRLENVKSVLSFNFAISDFIARFSGELPDVTNWPRIHLQIRGETIHPLVIDPYVVKEIFDWEELQLPENQLISDKLSLKFCCINSKREVLQVDQDASCMDIANRSGRGMKSFCEIQDATANSEGDDQHVKAFAIDRYDNVYLIIKFNDRTTNKYVFVLLVYDITGKKRHERVLHLQFEFEFLLSITLKLCVNNDIFIHQNGDDSIYVFDINGNLKFRLSLERNSSNHRSGDDISMECVTDDDDIIMRTRQSVLLYTKEGKLKQTINVKNDIEAVSYNCVTSKIEILVKKESILGMASYYILSYSESNEVERLYLPIERNSRRLRFCNHAVGPTALMIHNHRNKNHIILM